MHITNRNFTLEKTRESPLDVKVIKQSQRKLTLNIHWKDWWSWSVNTLATWCKSRLIGKDTDAGKDWRQNEKGASEDETVGWHHQFNGHEFEQTPRNSEGQRNLVCCSSWRHKESDTTWQLNNSNNQTLEFFLKIGYNLQR